MFKKITAQFLSVHEKKKKSSFFANRNLDTFGLKLSATRPLNISMEIYGWLKLMIK